MELEHVIGFTGRAKDTLHAHPKDSDVFITSMGAAVIVGRVSDSHSQEFLRAHDEEITALSVSRSGLLLASGQLPSTRRNGAGAVIVVWELATHAQLYHLQGFSCRIIKMSFSPDDHFLLAAGQDGQVILWDLRTSEVVFTKTFASPVTILNWGRVEEKTRRPKYTLTFAHSSQLIVNELFYDIACMQYKLESSPCSMPSTGMVREYLSASMTQTNDTLLAGTFAGELVVFNADARVFKCTIPISSNGVHSIACCPANGYIYVGAGDGMLKKLVGAHSEWNLVGQVQLIGAISGLAVACDGQTVLAGTAAGRIFRVHATDLIVQELTVSHLAPVMACAFSGSSSESFASLSKDGSLKVWDLSSYRVKCSASENIAGLSLCYSKHQNNNSASFLVTGWADGWLRAYDADNGTRVWHISKAHRGEVTSVVANDKCIVSGSTDGGVNIWSISTRELLMQFHEHKRGVTQVLIDIIKPHHVHSCGLDRALFIYDLKTERRAVVHQVREGAFHSMSQRLDSENEIITGGADGRLLFWDCDVSEAVKAMQDPNHVRISTLQVSPSGRFLATGSDDCHIKIYLINDDVMIASAQGHSNAINQLAWSPDERQLVSHKYATSLVGAKDTVDARLVFRSKNNKVISPWHDIPLRPAGFEKDPSIFNFVNEIPKGGRAKMEIATKEENNPIKQDVKKGNLRFYHFDSLVNYGCIPQTWEDPEHIDESTRYGGDNDPIDVVEIGSRVAETGEVYPVKVLGVLGMIDEDETDWKVIAIATTDPLADKLHDLNDVLLNLPQIVPNIRTWFRDYKIPDGKPPSEFAFDGKAMDKSFAIQVIEQTHTSWKQLNVKKLSSALWLKH
ncbi:hypothetical protein THRCLA_04030 [Thraustotheca clavata]|uniref:inorganic diphosphatase n=1 Tax=Thraustotheca clavata TaxID=74557 RepID=A0A1W0A040_9STRA|nr:hypothetical protein THRCLA_04030 [Thraustotheca clavata]